MAIKLKTFWIQEDDPGQALQIAHSKALEFFHDSKLTAPQVVTINEQLSSNPANGKTIAVVTVWYDDSRMPLSGQ